MKELQELNSPLADVAPQSTYRVPAGYFDGLADELLKQVKALEASSAKEELDILSPLLGSIKKETPFTVPAGYFDTIGTTMEQTVLQGTEQDAQAELEDLSPLLSGLKNKSTYAVPAGYFENLKPVIPGEAVKPAAKVIPFTQRKWVRYAAAAVIIGFVATFGFLNNSKPEKIDPSTKSFAWVEKNLKKVSTDDITQFVESVNLESGEVLAKTDSKKEMNDLLKDVSDKEIQDFLNDTQAGEASADDDLILN